MDSNNNSNNNYNNNNNNSNNENKFILNIGVEVVVAEKSSISFKRLKESFEVFLRETPNKQKEVVGSLIKLKSLEKTVTFMDYPDRSIVDYYKAVLLGISTTSSLSSSNNPIDLSTSTSSSNLFINEPSPTLTKSPTNIDTSIVTSKSFNNKNNNNNNNNNSFVNSKSNSSSDISIDGNGNSNDSNNSNNNINNNNNSNNSNSNSNNNSNNNNNINNNNNNNNNNKNLYNLQHQDIDKSIIKYKIFIYKLSHDLPQSELIDEQESFSPYQQLLLPNKSFETLWETLIYEEGLKSNLLSYMSTLILFSKLKIDSNICSNNKVIFLYGPPGTGKTSLAKALAQKISILYKEKFSYTQLIEINTHSLFSKWFSESGKLVMRMFENIKEILEDQNCFVMILIDEVESLAAARNASIESGTEPSDSIRVVNAFLTQLDQLKAFSNVLIVATSNITKAVDLAFIDRADIKQFIGPPSLNARKYILQTIYNELSLKGVLNDYDFNDLQDDQLDIISKNTESYSGRSLRKLPTVAISSHISFTSLPISSKKFTNILLDYINTTNIFNNKLFN